MQLKPGIRSFKLTAVAPARSELPPVVVTYLVEEGMWCLETEYHYPDDGHKITVPEGFKFDLASVPRIFWSIIAPFELSVAAPLIHDFLYAHAGKPPQGAVVPVRTYSRKDADVLFREIMKKEGVPGWRHFLGYWAVHLFGWTGWGRSPLEA